jgi:Flp pilus assembly protein TadD
MRTLARLHAVQNDPEAAGELLKKLVALAPDDQTHQADLGDFYAARKEYALAEKAYASIRDKAPNIAAGYVKLANLYAMQGEKEKSIEPLRAGYAKNPGLLVLFDHLVKQYLAFGHQDLALKVVKERLQSHGQDSLAYNHLGRIHTLKKEYPQAEAAFNKAITLQPRWQEPHNNLATIHLLQGRQQEAIAGLNAAIKANPKNETAYLTLGALYEHDGNIPLATKSYEDALKEMPGLWSAANNLAFLLSEHGRSAAEKNKALSLAEQALASKPNDGKVLDTLGWVHFKLGNMEKARLYLEQALENAPEQPELNYHLGVVLHAQGKKAEARQKLEVAVKSKDEFKGRQEAARILKEIS